MAKAVLANRQKNEKKGKNFRRVPEQGGGCVKFMYRIHEYVATCYYQNLGSTPNTFSFVPHNSPPIKTLRVFDNISNNIF